MSTKNPNRHNPLIDRIGEFNPQLFREIKGKLKGKNIAIALALSALFQLIFYWGYESALPLENISSYRGQRYCLAFSSDRYTCIRDSFGNLVNWPLWWLDIFIWMSVIGIFALLVAGIYLLVADLSKEESRGTLNFIRMSPKTATNILFGKMLGVPILLYLAVILALPLHLWAGLAAGIPFHLILVFYGVIIASCIFFYSAALLLGLVKLGVSGFKPWLGSGFVLLFLWLTTAYLMDGLAGYVFDLISSFNPLNALFYLVDASSVDLARVDFTVDKLSEDSLWYGISIWQQAWTGIGFLLLNFALWTYVIWQGVRRSFHNPISTVFSKKQSYFISGIFSIISLGFCLQNRYSDDIIANFAFLQFFLLILFFGTIAAISPHRQTLQDWARYRHQNSGKRSLIGDLIWGEKSPSTLAIAINLLIATTILCFGLVLYPDSEHKIEVFSNLILFANTILIFAAIAQLILFMKTPKRAILAGVTIFALMVVPLVVLAVFGINPDKAPHLFLFTVLPMIGVEYATKSTIIFSLLGQFLAIALVNSQLTKQLKKSGESETKALFSN